MENVPVAIILAAGKSTRTYPITLDRPKSLLRVLNKPIIFHTLDALFGLVRRVVIIVGYKKEMIRNVVGHSYRGIKIDYVEQPEISGTGGAVRQLMGKIHGRFLVLNGDDLYMHEDIERLFRFHYAVLAQKVSDPSRFGVLITDTKNRLKRLIEKPAKQMGNLVNTGCYLFDEKIFEYELSKSPRGEYEVTDYLFYLAKQYGVQVVTVKKYWIALSYSWDLLQANRYVLQHDFHPVQSKRTKREPTMCSGLVQMGERIHFGNGIRINGPVVIGNDVTLKDHVVLSPYTVVEDNVVIQHHAVVADSLVMDASVVGPNEHCHHSIVTPKYTITLNKAV